MFLISRGKLYIFYAGLLKLNKDNSIFPTSMIASGVAALLGLVIITAVVVVIVRKRQANR